MCAGYHTHLGKHLKRKKRKEVIPIDTYTRAQINTSICTYMHIHYIPKNTYTNIIYINI